MSKPPTEKQRAAWDKQRTKVDLAPSCAGCPFHDMNTAGEKYQTDPEGRTLFNHWCKKPANQEVVGIVPVHELTHRIAPPVPSWCDERRPSFTV